MCSVALKPPHELSCSSQRSEVAGGHILLGRVPREPVGCCSGWGGTRQRRAGCVPGRAVGTPGADSSGHGVFKAQG